jgi:hypothetical protein
MLNYYCNCYDEKYLNKNTMIIIIKKEVDKELE